MRIMKMKALAAALAAASLACAAAHAADGEDPVLKMLATPASPAQSQDASQVQLPAQPLPQQGRTEFSRPLPDGNSLKAAEASPDAAPGEIPKALRDLSLPPSGISAALPDAGALPGVADGAAPGAAGAQGQQPLLQAAAAADAADDSTVPFQSTLTFDKLGAPDGVVLRAGQTDTGLDFTLPLDKVITSAKLSLDIEVTDDMAKRGSHLEITLNGQPIGTLPLNNRGGPVRYDLTLPFEYIGTANNFNFKVADDDEFSCMVDYTRRYMVSILPDSTLSLEGHRLEIGSDLSMFPMPFFDPYDVTKSDVKIVLPKQPDADSISAAAMLASWFGVRSDYRGVKFSALFGDLPSDNAIIIGRPGQKIGGITMPAQESVSIIKHPLSPAFKLVLICAKNRSRLRDAVYALTKGDIPQNATAISDVKQASIKGRDAYDAPKWIPTNRKVYLSELLRPGQSLVSTGLWHPPLNLSFRAAPDLYQLYGEPVQIALDYNFPLESWIDEDHSWLNVVLSGNFLENVPVNKLGAVESLWRLLGGDAREEHREIPVQPYMIYGDNNLSLYFDIKLKKGAPCSVLHDTNIKSALLDSSYIDLSNTDHFASLPNLSFFVGAGYPFTKFADYGQTLMLLPQSPSPSEVQTLLDLAARSGKATGWPVWSASVIMGEEQLSGNAQLSNSDILAVSTLKNSKFMSRLLRGSSLIYSDSGRDISVREYGPLNFEDGITKALGRLLSGDWRPENVEATRYLRSNMLWRGFMSRISPWNDSRIVVIATASDDAQLRMISDDLDNDQVNRSIGGDLSIISGQDSVRSFSVGDKIYSGNVSSYFKLLFLLAKHEVWLAIAGFIAVAFAGYCISGCLRRRARRRIAGSLGQLSDEEKKK